MYKSLTPNFTPTITKAETFFGWIYTPIHIFVLPFVLSYLLYEWYPDISDVHGNLVYYGVSLAVVLPVFWKMLRREFDGLYDHPFRCIGTLCWGYCIWYGMSMVMAAIMMLLNWTEEAPNDVAFDQMAQGAYNLTMFISCIAAPILEEILFRGVLFQSLRKKNRVLAYVVNILLFGFIHVWQYVLIYGEPVYLLYTFQYIPISFALIWVYEYSGSLWTAIFFHGLNNYLSMMIMQSM